MLPDLSGLAVRDEEPVGMEGDSSSGGGGGGGGFEFAPPDKLQWIGPENDVHGRTRLVKQRSGTGPPVPLAEDVIRIQRSSTERTAAVVEFYSNVDPLALNMSADQKELAPYNRIIPVGVFDIEYNAHHPMFTQYEHRRVQMQHSFIAAALSGEEDWCRDYGSPLECVRTDKVLGTLAEDEPLGRLASEINEKYLVHGTSVDGVYGILNNNFDMRKERLGSATFLAYGPSIYQAEDAGKADVYGRSEDSLMLKRQLNIDLLTEGFGPRTTVYYAIITRTLLGCANHVASHSFGQEDTKDLRGRMVYHKTSDNSLAEHATSYQWNCDSVIVEHRTAPRGGFGRYWREFLVRDVRQVIPVMLVAFVRHLDSAATFDHRKLGCDPQHSVPALLAIVSADLNSVSMEAVAEALKNLRHHSEHDPSIRRLVFDALKQIVQTTATLGLPERWYWFASPAFGKVLLDYDHSESGSVVTDADRALRSDVVDGYLNAITNYDVRPGNVVEATKQLLVYATGSSRLLDRIFTALATYVKGETPDVLRARSKYNRVGVLDDMLDFQQMYASLAESEIARHFGGTRNMHAYLIALALEVLTADHTMWPTSVLPVVVFQITVIIRILTKYAEHMSFLKLKEFVRGMLVIVETLEGRSLLRANRVKADILLAAIIDACEDLFIRYPATRPDIGQLGYAILTNPDAPLPSKESMEHFFNKRAHDTDLVPFHMAEFVRLYERALYANVRATQHEDDLLRLCINGIYNLNVTWEGTVFVGMSIEYINVLLETCLNYPDGDDDKGKAMRDWIRDALHNAVVYKQEFWQHLVTELLTYATVRLHSMEKVQYTLVWLRRYTQKNDDLAVMVTDEFLTTAYRVKNETNWADAGLQEQSWEGLFRLTRELIRQYAPLASCAQKVREGLLRIFPDEFQYAAQIQGLVEELGWENTDPDNVWDKLKTLIGSTFAFPAHLDELDKLTDKLYLYQINQAMRRARNLVEMGVAGPLFE